MTKWKNNKIKNKKERKVQVQDTYCAYNVQSAETRLSKTWTKIKKKIMHESNIVSTKVEKQKSNTQYAKDVKCLLSVSRVNCLFFTFVIFLFFIWWWKEMWNFGEVDGERVCDGQGSGGKRERERRSGGTKQKI